MSEILDNSKETAAEVFAFPASFAQKRLWFLDQVNGPEAVYNIPQALRLRGPLDVTLLERSIGEIFRRHESLRTVFTSVEGTAQQVVDGRLDLNVQSVDLTAETDPLSKALELANREAQSSFDLTKGPLVRAIVFKLATDDHVFFLNVHHIICDGASLTLFFGELGDLYKAFRDGRQSPLPEVEIQYADYAIWEKETFESADAHKVDIDFWRTYLSGDLPLLTLPFDHVRPANASRRGGLVQFDLSAELTDRINQLARSERVSLFMTLLAAFHVFLSRISGETDIRVGSPIASRDREEVQRSIGFYTNTVVFRTDLTEPTSFRQLLRRVRDSVTGVLAHQEVPLEKVVEAVAPDRRAGDNPLFQVMFAVQKAPESALSIPGVEVTLLPIHSATSKFDMLVEMQELERGMQCFLEYATDMFEAETAERLARHFQTLLENLTAAPDTLWSDIPMLDDEWRQRLLLEWNRTDADFDRSACLHDLIRRSVDRTPEAVAARFGDKQITYGELYAKAARLAAYLQSNGVGPDRMVGIFCDRSIDMLIGLVGILTAGGAYLPLDPSFPKDRIRYMLEDAAVSLVITQQHLVDDLPDFTGRVFCLDGDWAGAEAAHLAPATASPDNLAYMIYTSGSTGKPKGVQIRNSAVVNFLTSMAKKPGFTSSDSILAVTTLSFDISVLELFLPLSVGGTTVIASHDDAVDGLELMSLLERSGATMMQATPSTWLMLLEVGWKPQSPLKILCGGEAWPAGLAEQLLSRCSELWNMYGPTETTVWSTCFQVKDGDDVVIGKPIANTQTYVVDRHMQPVAVGVYGELFIGGAALARGYHNRTDLTSDRFTANPFRPGELMYRTGDMVRYRRDGNLQYESRMDGQVKVRGFRIELGEIESALAKHAAIKQNVVSVWSTGGGDKRLCAYIVYREGARPLTNSELRTHLRASLPEYMLPHLFVALTALPLTQNGKVNRKMLPDPDGGQDASAKEFVPPQTESQKLVAELWKEILKVERVGLRDNFFDLGGHSLLSTQVLFRLEKMTGVRLNPRSMVFQDLEGIAAEIGGPASVSNAGSAAKANAVTPGPQKLKDRTS